MENHIIEDSDDDLAEIEETIINLNFSWLAELFSNRKIKTFGRIRDSWTVIIIIISFIRLKNNSEKLSFRA